MDNGTPTYSGSNNNSVNHNENAQCQDQAIEQVIHLISKMLTNTHAPVRFYQNDIVSLANSLSQIQHHCSDHLQTLISTELVPSIKSLSISHKVSNTQFPSISPERLDALREWDFNPFECTELELLALIRHMFEYFNLLERYDIPIQRMELFLLNIRDHYHTNAYHNILHGFDVSQTAFYLLTTGGVQKYVTENEIFVILLACICHDIGHPGQNNAYLVNSESDLALKYNDKSVLENHHCYTTFKLLQIPELNILANIPLENRRILKNGIIDSILATDMAVHFSFHMENINKRLQNPLPLSRESDADRKLLTVVLVHLCDLGNLARPFHLSKDWCERVTEEQFQQGALEKAHGWQPNTKFDPAKTTCALNMAQFIDEVVEDFFTVIKKLVPETKTFLDILETNRKEWEVLIKQDNSRKEN